MRVYSKVRAVAPLGLSKIVVLDDVRAGSRDSLLGNSSVGRLRFSSKRGGSRYLLRFVPGPST